MTIKRLNTQELKDSLPFVCEVFNEFEAKNYSEDERNTFYKAIHDVSYISSLEAYGAFIDGGLVGIFATRNDRTHIALFFVDGKFQNQGIGRKLFVQFLNDLKKSCTQTNNQIKITVNSSIFAKDIYKKLGFSEISKLQKQDGIQYIPMEYKIDY